MAVAEDRLEERIGVPRKFKYLRGHLDDETLTTFQREALDHSDALYGFAMYLTRNPPKADDLVQETYLRAFRFSYRFQPGTHLRAWLFRILRNTFFTFYRIRDREAAVAKDGIPDWDVPMFHDAPYEDANATGVHIDLERAMRRLPEEFRTVLLLAEVEGLPLEEVARVMSCPVGTVKSRIFRAKEKLRGLLRDYHELVHRNYPSENGGELTNGTTITSYIPHNRGYLRLNRYGVSPNESALVGLASQQPHESYEGPQLPTNSELNTEVKRFEAEEILHRPILYDSSVKNIRHRKPKGSLEILARAGGRRATRATHANYPANSHVNGKGGYSAGTNGASNRHYPLTNGAPQAQDGITENDDSLVYFRSHPEIFDGISRLQLLRNHPKVYSGLLKSRQLHIAFP